MPWHGCTTAGCYRPAQCHGLCRRCYDHARYAGLLEMPQRRCDAVGCLRAAHGRGLCDKHLKTVAAERSA